MSRCGFVSFYNSETNYNGNIKIRSYPCSSVKQITGELSFSEYSFCKQTFKLLERNVHNGTELPYTLLLKILNTAVRFDKANEFPVMLAFSFDSNCKLNLSEYCIEKQIFPMPFKNISYMQKLLYANVTPWLLNNNVTHNLMASVACDLLNSVAVNDGIIDNKLFEYSCGRLFINASFIAQSLRGRKILKQVTKGCKSLLKVLPAFPSKISLYSSNVNFAFNDNTFYSNKILELHTNAVRIACKQKLYYYISNPTALNIIIQKEVNEILQNINLHSLNIPGTKPKDFVHLGLPDILKSYTDADFRYNLSEYIAHKRKIYNENKSRVINYFKSDGTLY